MSNDLIQGTAVSAVAPVTDSYRVTYQLENGTIQQKDETGNTTDVDTSVAVVSSPLATISWNDGDEIRVFGLDKNRNIVEFRYTEGEGWKQGSIFIEETVRAAPGAGLAAAVAKVEDRVQVHLYFQDPTSGYIRELIDYGGRDNWSFGYLTIEDAIAITNLAAAAYTIGTQLHAHVFYQTAKLALKEYYFDGSWKKGGFNPSSSTVPARTPIAALSFVAGQLPQVQIYWHGRDGKISFAQRNGSVWGNPQSTGVVAGGYKFSVIEWSKGKLLRLFYQELLGSLVVYQSNDGGKTWTGPSGLN